MNIIVCLDERNGILFHNRRQSRDAMLCADVMKISAGSTLRMNAYSAALFADYSDHIKVSDDFLDIAQPQEFCFVENVSVFPAPKTIEKIIVYRWNRKYPADTFFSTEYLLDKQLLETMDFPGKSHPKITREVYVG